MGATAVEECRLDFKAIVRSTKESLLSQLGDETHEGEPVRRLLSVGGHGCWCNRWTNERWYVRRIVFYREPTNPNEPEGVKFSAIGSIYAVPERYAGKKRIAMVQELIAKER